MKCFLVSLVASAVLLFSALPAYCQSAQDAESKGEAAAKKGDLDSAIANFSEAIRLDPRFYLAYCNRGRAYQGKHELEKAIADYTEAIRIDPKSTTAYVRRADAYFPTVDVDKAIADDSTAIDLDPSCIDAYIDRSSAYGFKGEYDKAMTDAREAVRLDPKSAIAHNHVAIAYDRVAGKMSRSDDKTADLLFDHASRFFEGPPGKLDESQQQLPFDGSMEHYRVAAKKLDRKHKTQLLFDYSAAAFKAAIDIKPDYDFGNNNLGVYYARRDDPEALKLAEKYFRAALRVNPRYCDAYNNLGIMLMREGKLDEAITVDKAAIALRADGKASDHNNLSHIYLLKGELDNALEENSVALKLDPKFLPAWSSRAEIYVKQKKLDEAAKSLQRMVAIDASSSDTISAQMAFARKCVELKRFDDAVASLGQFLKVNQSAPEIYFVRGYIYVHQGELQRAKQDFEQVLRLRPQFPEAQKQLEAVRSQLEKPAGERPHE